ncbi:afadin isoform X3 [Folsomia candida]|uniref:afadin isoform X3 n=1 Tax=Folsomia candida TaxID=158441 RepID=UPI000B9090C0|nr:afadin isoform X3 [Folsomia candida]
MGANGEAMDGTILKREALRQLIAQWNANRLDLFEISEPNEDGEFQGVMRFYFQEAGAKVATKCVRISSTATTKAVIETLVEKFRPDMRMLSIPQYALYEIHENGEERRLGEPERPLFVQLNWHSDDREGRFLLKRIDEVVRYDFYTNTIKDAAPTVNEGFKRKLSKREKKQLKKMQENTKTEQSSSAAEKLYNELPESGFTRSISNPEAVMRRRRQQKLEKKLAQFRSRDGGPDTGGTLKIYGQSLCADVPYKTLLLSVNDTAVYVVKEMLAKYGLTTQDPQNYCLYQVCEGEGESILDDDESPLSILMNQSNDRGSIMFHVRRRPPDYHPRKRKKKPGRRADEEGLSGYRGSYGNDGQLEPMLIELLPDGSETGRRITLESDVTEVGSEWWGGLQLAGLRPRHCVIANTEGIVTLTPSSRDSDIYVNGQRIYETTMLQHGAIIRFGRTHYFRFSQRNSPTGNRTFNERAIRPDSILPATLELPEVGEDAFLSLVVVNISPATLHFKLSPTYAIYLSARYRATTHFRPDATPHERAHLLSAFLIRVAHLMMQTVQDRNTDANSLAFWMANSSELLHFLKSDRQIGAFSVDAQDILAEVVQLSFRHLVTCIQGEISNLVGHFFLERDEDDENATSPMIGVLGSTMTLLRRSRVNAALTIQLFSQVFHFVNMAVFNKLIGMDGRNYCSRTWGNRLRRRINRIETWAEKQGLELAADCHLVRIIQATHLLQAMKNTAEEVSTAASSCFKLNSMQLRCLLMKYQYDSDEAPISPEILENVVRVAESTVDDVIRGDGRHIRVEEEPLLGLAFLLPEDGYSCDIVRGIPTGLVEFLSPLSPVCRLTPNTNAAGYWTIFFHDPMRSPSAMSGRSFAAAFNNMTGSGMVVGTPGSVIGSERHSFINNHTGVVNNHHHGVIGNNMPMSPSSSNSILANHHNNHAQQQLFSSNQLMPPPGAGPEIQTIKLQKISGGLGLSIVAAKAAGQEKLGIYIKSVVSNGSADMDGRLATGDQLLSVDGQSLVGISQEEAAKYLVRTGPIVTLEVAKQAAVYQGIASMLNQPSPEISRGGFNASRRMSERDLPSKVEFTDPSGHLPPGHPLNQQRIQASKSVPALNSDVPNTVQPMVRSPGHGGSAPYGAHHNDQQRSYAQHYPSASMTMHPSSSKGGMMPGINSHDSHHPRSRSIQSLLDPRPDMVHKQPSTPALHQQSEEPERFYQNVGFYPPPAPTHPANVPVRTYIPYSNSTGNISSSASSGFRSPIGQHQPMPGQYYPGSNGPSNYPGPRPPPPNLNTSVPGNLNWARAQQQQQHHPQQGVNRDLLRQEAKMLEMQDELRRREERNAIMLNKQVQQQNYLSRYGPSQPQQRPMHPGHGQRPLSSSGPPPAPKPFRPGDLGGDMSPGGVIHHQTQFSASAGEIPRGSYLNNGHIPKSPLNPANPWEREAKEVEAGRKKEAAKYWRDQQIAELESLLNRSPSQDEQLRALKLEREFQRRAAEEIRKDDEGENEEEEEETNERKAMIRRLQEDLDKTRITSTNGGGRLDHAEEERSRKIEEMKKKKMELEAAQAAEERLIREASKRREEELKRQMQQHSFPYQSPYRTSYPPKQLGSPVSNPYPMENHQQQPQHYHLSPTTAAAPPLPKSPPPTLYRPPPLSNSPDKISPPQTSPRPRSDKKTVSFNETVATNEPPPTPPEQDEMVGKVREDPNKFFTEATAMLASPRSPDAVTPTTGSTPGVIGAQEVYKDPRMRRLAEQQQKQPASTPKPEKLSFKEKMKMFAMETGEVETPKDKVKVSKAQREIETVPPGTPTTAGGNN